MKILKRESLKEGGFAGLKEHRLIKSPHLFIGKKENDPTWSGKVDGKGDFAYLADARFMPHGETHMHNHLEIDVITVMVDGNISHEGSLEHGQDLSQDDVQVQRAGGEGFSHNEINPDGKWNRLLQLWVLPETEGQAAKYKVTRPALGELTRIYGGTDFPSKTKIDVAVLNEGQQIQVDQPFLAYVSRGEGVLNNERVEDGDLISGDAITFKASNDVQLIVIHIGEK